MKTIVETPVGGDGAKAGLYVGDGMIEAKVAMPIAKLVEPATSAFDKAMDKLEGLIPGDWDKPMIAKVKEEFKAELVKLIGS